MCEVEEKILLFIQLEKKQTPRLSLVIDGAGSRERTNYLYAKTGSKIWLGLSLVTCLQWASSANGVEPCGWGRGNASLTHFLAKLNPLHRVSFNKVNFQSPSTVSCCACYKGTAWLSMGSLTIKETSRYKTVIPSSSPNRNKTKSWLRKWGFP